MNTTDLQSDRAQTVSLSPPGTALWPAVAAGSLAAAALFAFIIPGLSESSAAGPFLERYFSGHPLQKFTTLIFCIGIAVPAGRLLALPRQRKALAAMQTFCGDSGWPGETSPGQAREQLAQWLSTSQTARFHRTFVGYRLSQLTRFLSHRRSGSVADHLRYLAELAVEQLVQSYHLVRTVTWAVPIIGFLGTVIGITMAIANVTPEQLDSSLPEVTSGLAVAFDTTAQALGLSLMLVFATFLAERSEQRLLSDVEQFGVDVLQPTFSSESTAGGNPEEALIAPVREQLNQWTGAIAELQQNWQSTLLEQTQALSVTFSGETELTLQQHRHQLELTKEQYAETLQRSAEQLSEKFQQSVGQFAVRMEAWQSALLASSQDAAAQSESLHQLGQTMLQLTEAEERLASLQSQLNRSLESAQVVNSLEQAISSLNAAVAMLSTKVSPRAAA